MRKQIIVSPEVDALIRRLGRTRRISPSRVVAEAVEALRGPENQLAGVLAFAGTIKAAPRTLSKEVNQSAYRGGRHR